jgi:hypothetical protein
MAIVVFVPADFKTVYPEFAAVPDVQLEYYFAQAEIYLDNTNASPVHNVNTRKILLWMLTAHIAQLAGVLENTSGSSTGLQPVGRTSSATEGSVSVDFEYKVPGTASWYTQTQYGAAYWEATSSVRTIHYLARPTIY